jgi:hypothetical protein
MYIHRHTPTHASTHTHTHTHTHTTHPHTHTRTYTQTRRPEGWVESILKNDPDGKNVCFGSNIGKIVAHVRPGNCFDDLKAA